MNDLQRKNWFYTPTGAFILLLLSSLALAKTSLGTPLKHVSSDLAAYSILAEDIDGDGRVEMIAGAFDHHVYVMDLAGKILWSFNVGGLPSHLATCDTNKDGTKEIAVVVQKTPASVVVLAYKKGVVWTFEDDLPFLSLAVGDFEGDGSQEIAVGSFLGALHILDIQGALKLKKTFFQESLISALAFGQLDKRLGDELVVGTSRDGVYAINKQGDNLWHLKARAPKDRKKRKKKGKRQEKKRHPRYKMEKVQSIQVTDINGDGKAEVIVGSRPNGMVTVIDWKGRKLWQKNFPQMVNKTAASKVVVGHFDDDVHQKLFCLLGGVILEGRRATTPAVLLNFQGDNVAQTFPSSLFFSLTAANLDQDTHDEVLLSSSARGKGVNILSITPKWQNALSAYKGAAQLAIEANLEKMDRARSGSLENAPLRKFHFLYRINFKDLYRKRPQVVKRYLSRFVTVPGENAVILTGLYEKQTRFVSVKATSKNRLDFKGIMEIIEWFESNEIPFYLNIAKHAKLYFRIKTLEQILKNAPRYCRGFVVDENNYTRTRKWGSFLQELDQILGILFSHKNKKLIMNEYMGFWHRFPLEERIFNTLFNPKYKDTLIPIYKPNNVKYPELNLGVLVGLWKTGQVNNWGVGAYADIWKWAAEHYGAPGDVIMRLMVMSISMGGNYFVLARNVLEESKEYLDLADGYKRYFQTLYHLIRSDVLRPVENQNYVLLSPFAIHERPDLKEIRSRSAGTQIYWQNAYGMKGPLDGGFFLQSVRKNYLIQSFYPYMLSYYDGLFPKTPYGYIAILPAVMEPIKTGFFCDYWVVDGDGLYDKNGKRVGIEQLPTVIQNCLGELKNRLPVMTPDAFLISHKTPEGYKVYLINPYVFEAKDVKARVTVHIRNGKIRITDGITGYPISFGGNTLEIVIPAGLFRIINITHE